jgi:hypothetical protein
MSEQMFIFDPAKYAEHFARHGYVHIPGGVSEQFYAKLVKQVDENMKSKKMKEFAIGDKQQAMYEFPDGADYAQELCDKIAAVCALKSDDIVISERHIKAYDADAQPHPNAHKDRYASQISVGLSVQVKERSTLVLYPYDENDINPFNTSVALRASLSPDRYPEPRLTQARRVEIQDAARDVIVFRGHTIWHLRENPANTTMLYLKLNAFNCDPLGEDRRTPPLRQETENNARVDDSQIGKLIPQIGRRVDYIHRMYTRDWREVAGVVLWNEKHFSVDEDELKMMQAMDGKRSVEAVAAAAIAASGADRAAVLEKVRRLARRGVIELLGKAQ